jgi:hypothetical protein
MTQTKFVILLDPINQNQTKPSQNHTGKMTPPKRTETKGFRGGCIYGLVLKESIEKAFQNMYRINTKIYRKRAYFCISKNDSNTKN